MSSYHPSWPLNNGHINTIAAASYVRKRYALSVSKNLHSNSESIILELSDNVRLQGFLSTGQTDEKPLVFLLHGWLGCADSLYLLPLASLLYAQSFTVFRLNFRDHGNTQHLNKELFHSCRLKEVCEAVQYIQQVVKHSALYLIGFSLGGNFALRIGADADDFGLKIKKIYSISPVMDPEQALNETESMHKIYTRYYLQRWKQMLYKKHTHFPGALDLNKINHQTSLTGMTEHLLLQYTEFNCLKDYLHGYSIIGDRLSSLKVQSDVYIAKDDPVIPYQDYKKLHASKQLDIHINENGGHCGFLNSLFNINWVDENIIHSLNQYT